MGNRLIFKVFTKQIMTLQHSLELFRETATSGLWINCSLESVLLFFFWWFSRSSTLNQAKWIIHTSGWSVFQNQLNLLPTVSSFSLISVLSWLLLDLTFCWSLSLFFCSLFYKNAPTAMKISSCPVLSPMAAWSFVPLNTPVNSRSANISSTWWCGTRGKPDANSHASQYNEYNYFALSKKTQMA